jgi:CPA1 family monovalent cation:H+ antiporter
VIQGLTLKPLLQALNLHDGDPVGQEVRTARERALEAGLASLAGESSPVADVVRKAIAARLAEATADDAESPVAPEHAALHGRALHAARGAVLALRESGAIGDDAFHKVEEDLDWLEMAGGPQAG